MMNKWYDELSLAWVCFGCLIFGASAMAGDPISRSLGARILSASFVVASLWVLWVSDE